MKKLSICVIDRDDLIPQYYESHVSEIKVDYLKARAGESLRQSDIVYFNNGKSLELLKSEYSQEEINAMLDHYIMR